MSQAFDVAHDVGYAPQLHILHGSLPVPQIKIDQLGNGFIDPPAQLLSWQSVQLHGVSIGAELTSEFSGSAVAGLDHVGEAA